MSKPIINFSVTGDRGIATLEVLAAVKRWIRARDALSNERMAYGPPIWALIDKEQQALKDLEEVARKLLRGR